MSINTMSLICFSFPFYIFIGMSISISCRGVNIYGDGLKRWLVSTWGGDQDIKKAWHHGERVTLPYVISMNLWPALFKHIRNVVLLNSPMADLLFDYSCRGISGPTLSVGVVLFWVPWISQLRIPQLLSVLKYSLMFFQWSHMMCSSLTFSRSITWHSL